MDGRQQLARVHLKSGRYFSHSVDYHNTMYLYVGADRNLVAQSERVCNCFAIMEINTNVHHIRHKSKTLIRGELSHDHWR